MDRARVSGWKTSGGEPLERAGVGVEKGGGIEGDWRRGDFGDRMAALRTRAIPPSITTFGGTAVTETSRETIQRLERELSQAKARIAELEKRLSGRPA